MKRSTGTLSTCAMVAAWMITLMVLPFAGLAGGTYEHARALGKRCATCHDSVHPDIENLNSTGRFFLVNRRLPGDGERSPAAPRQLQESGAAIYKRACATCHGADGSGTALGPNLLGTLESGATPEALIAIVRNGVPGTAMVAFKGTLSDEQIERSVEHLLALRKLPSP